MPQVLVVDDEPDVRALLEMYLSVEGYEVVSAANGCDALDQLDRIKPCVILLDLMMPVMDGIEFRRRQQERPDVRSIPVLCVSAKHDAAATAARLGFRACFPKPFDLAAVGEAVRRVCGGPSGHS